MYNFLKGILSQGGYDPISSAYFARMTTPPSSDFKAVIDTYFVKNSKVVNSVTITAKSIIAKADVIYLGNINDSNDSFINLVKNAHHGTKQGSGLVWDAYWGYSNPAGTGYVDTNYNPSTQGVNYLKDSAGIGCYFNNIVLQAGFIYPIGSGLSPYIGIRFDGAINNESAVINGTTVFSTTSIPFRMGLRLLCRTASNAANYKNQNISNVTSSGVSTSIPNENIGLFRRTAGVTLYTGGLNFTYIGASLTDDEFNALNQIVNEYLKQCLYLKYGASNWGVQMAKSYFDTLHNFEPYEAWEIYEFIKRHQSDYVDGILGNLIPSASSDFSTDGTSYWTAGNGSRAWNASDLCLDLTSTTSGYIQKVGLLVSGRSYTISVKFRSAGFTNRLRIGDGSVNIYSGYCTSVWQTFSGSFTASSTGFVIQLESSYAGLVQIDDIVVQETQTKGYLHTTFQPTKTVADYIMLFKAGGNLAANAWTKTGTTLRWNQDGTITSSNTMPAYTRGTNLGIVTVTSTDGWDGVSAITLNQTVNSVNSFYGNIAEIRKIRSNAAISLYITSNRFKFKASEPQIVTSIWYLYRVSFPGYIKVDMSKLSGTINVMDLREISNESNISGDMTGVVILVQSTFQCFGTSTNRFDNLVGNVKSFNRSGTNFGTIQMNYTGLTGGLGFHYTSISTINFSDCRFSTAEVDAQLALIDNYFVGGVVPVRNLTVKLEGSTMGIPTGGASNANLLSIVAKHVAAGFTATITVRTS